MSQENGDQVTEGRRPTAPRPRSYSHLSRNPESLDEIEVDGIRYKIPATTGSNYWAIVRVMYSHLNNRVYPEQLITEVDELMEEHNSKSCDRYRDKENSVVWKSSHQRSEIEEIADWKERIATNAKTLTRWKDNGRHLYERAHLLSWEYDDVGRQYLILCNTCRFASQ